MGWTSLDFVVLALYIAGVTAWGVWLGRGQQGARGYFLGGRDLPWGAVLFSVVATETSTLTFLSIPGIAYVTDFTFLQITLGYLIGRVVVATVLLPAYFRGDLETAYALLERRFGLASRRFASGIFMLTRALADGVRLFATAIPLALITGWSYPASIVAIGLLTLVYTYYGGIRSVVWVDALQMLVYTGGALTALWVLLAGMPGGIGGLLSEADAAGKLQFLRFGWDPAEPYTLWAGLIGGAFLSMASHGTDQLIVQRLLTCRDLRRSQQALIGSGVVVIFQFTLFLLIGLALWSFYGGAEFARTDEIFATFIIEQLPPGGYGFGDRVDLRGRDVVALILRQLAGLGYHLRSLSTASPSGRAGAAAGWALVHPALGGSAGWGGAASSLARYPRGRAWARDRLVHLRRIARRLSAGDSEPARQPAGCVAGDRGWGVVHERDRLRSGVRGGTDADGVGGAGGVVDGRPRGNRMALACCDRNANHPGNRHAVIAAASRSRALRRGCRKRPENSGRMRYAEGAERFPV